METNASTISHAGLDWSAARAHFRAVDPALHALAETMPNPEPSPERPVFESLARAILGQQLSVKAAATIWVGSPITMVGSLQRTECWTPRRMSIAHLG